MATTVRIHALVGWEERLEADPPTHGGWLHVEERNEDYQGRPTILDQGGLWEGALPAAEDTKRSQR